MKCDPKIFTQGWVNSPPPQSRHPVWPWLLGAALLLLALDRWLAVRSLVTSPGN
ncbi:MAG: hypothetical protein HYZ50_17265 [Deltaproteobacteria bacterium]|nr:hypothetical protein [Deltaproteobacteria bacterium]